MPEILAGWSHVDITPSKSAPLAGQFHTRISKGVRDAVTATALALSTKDASECCIMISLDALWVSDMALTRCREILKEKLPQVNPEKVFASATHTHAAPGQHISDPSDKTDGRDEAFIYSVEEKDKDTIMGAEEYSGFLGEKMAEAAIEAWKKRAPGGISYGHGNAVVGHNRRSSFFDGTSAMYGQTSRDDFSHMEGFEDHGVDALFVYNKSKKLTGMILNIPCPSQCSEHDLYVTADYWHDTRLELKKRFGKKLFILAQCGAAGDQSPHIQVCRAADTRMMKLKGLNVDDYHMARRAEIAKRIADAVGDILPTVVNDIRTDVPLRHEVLILPLPYQHVTKEEAEKYAAEAAKNEAELKKFENDDKYSHGYSFNSRRAKWFMGPMRRYLAQDKDKTLPMECHILRIGDVAFTSNRFEYYLDYGIRIKTRSKATQTFIVQLAGEGSYLPTERAMKGGSYGAIAPSYLVGPEGGQMIVEESLRAINKMFSE